MNASDDSSFYLYGMGERPEALTLGSLVLERYWEPLVARHYTHELLSQEALQEHAYVSNVSNVIFHGRSRLTPGISLSGGDIIDLTLAWNKDSERIVVAKKGARIILKDPEEFLATSVLRNPKAQEKLKLWLSAARSAYVLNFKFARRPKIWMLSGLYLLEDACTMVSRHSSSKISAGVSGSLVGALSSVPVGGFLNLGEGNSWEMTMELTEQHVWAAQYRLLDARFVKVDKRGADSVKLPLSMGLYRDVLSVGTVRGAETDEVELELKNKDQAGGESGQDVEDQDGEELEAYEKRLEEAISVFEKAPLHFLK
ncbi:hypothetical protein KXX35_002777 [Aspergillus fumigatus]|nr:hypothetical protein KXX20_007148 [Aspergillus fumigatus]KAH1818198.1 hypothetical protein KXX35_002777 [Aspergillus fumigatus]KAH1858457.1 hypothetical protein KXX55_004771 [Aspergillus fumigatus]KAH2311689.1 hypothetical protein KXV47_004424 [Aspergillus fumigatus]KAH3016551.1 hypothetical protein KXW60_007423 [Aspergillus fumigatus]